MKRLLSILFICVFSAGTLSGQRMVVLGDSLSDGGYYLGLRLTDPDGLLWHEYLADRIGYSRATTTSFGFSGLNLAISASRVSDLQSQVNRLGSRYTFQAADICTLWIGGNDLRDNPNQNMTLLADEIGDIIGQLSAIGIDHLIVPYLPDMGAIPEAPSGGVTRAERTAGSIAFNAALKLELEARALTHSMTIEHLDIFELFDEMLFYSSDYGFTNVSDPLEGSGGNPPEYAFWDEIHPTTRSHFLISSAALVLVDSQAPIELISQSLSTGGTLRQTWIADPNATYDVISGSQVNQMDITNSFLGSPAYTVEIPPPSLSSGFFQTRKN